VADDITRRAPDGNITGKNANRSYLGGFSQMMTDLPDVAAFSDDEHALLFYYPHTAVTSTAPAAGLTILSARRSSVTHDHGGSARAAVPVNEDVLTLPC